MGHAIFSKFFDPPPPLPPARIPLSINFEVTTTFLPNFIVCDIIASDVPGGNRILIIKIKAQHSALSKAIKNTEFK